MMMIKKRLNQMKTSNSMPKKLTTRDCSSVQEHRVANKLDGRVNSNSGAGRFAKSDVRVDSASLSIECKTTMTSKDSFSIKKEWIEKHKQEAWSNRLANSVIAFNFDYKDAHDYYVIDDVLMKFLVEKLREEYK